MLGAPDRWDYAGIYGTVLNNASFEQTSRRGLPGLRVRSSWERTRMALGSLAALARAESLAATPADRERIARRRAVLFGNWGFTRDASNALRGGGIPNADRMGTPSGVEEARPALRPETP